MVGPVIQCKPLVCVFSDLTFREDEIEDQIRSVCSGDRFALENSPMKNLEKLPSEEISMSNLSIKSPMKIQEAKDERNLRISNLIKVDPYDSLVKVMVKERHALYSKVIKDEGFNQYPKFESLAFYDTRFSEEGRNKYLRLRSKNSSNLELVTDIGLVLDVYKSKDGSYLNIKSNN
jgi:hypothetical protein